ncbi:MAG: hypothetical protein OJF51_001360 [Nitrospira sp.]|nr:MAG: hypothetical protein OJF51_001360 [Nitrospira sp.]
MPVGNDLAGKSRRPGNTLEPLLLRLAATVRQMTKESCTPLNYQFYS